MSLVDNLELIADVVRGVAGVCYYSPLVEKTAEGINGVRFFFRGAVSPMYSMVIDYLGSLDDIVGIEFFMGDKSYADGAGDFLVTFSKKEPLARILPFVKDFLLGNVTSESGFQVSRT